jgi:hypothetical protein
MNNDFTKATQGADAVVYIARWGAGLATLRFDAGRSSGLLCSVLTVSTWFSPLHLTGRLGQKDYKNPAVKGSENVLLAAKSVPRESMRMRSIVQQRMLTIVKSLPAIQHVSFTSSFAAVSTFRSTRNLAR